MSDVFISYSRRDSEFVHRLDAALAQLERAVWVDWEDIPVTAEWWREICQGIESADTYVFIITQNSLQSPVCNLELAHALANNKRIVPVIRERADEKAAFAALAALNLNETVQGMFAGRDPLIIARDNWRALSARNWLMFDSDDNFDGSLAKLGEVLTTDLERVRLHTRLLVQAREWDGRGRDPSFLLQGTELEEAQQFLAQSADKEPAPLALHGKYILASQLAAVERERHERQLERRARRNLQILFGAGFIVVLIITIGLVWMNEAMHILVERTTETILDSALISIAAGIDGDDFRGLVEEGQPRADGLSDDPRYWQQVEWLFQSRRFFPGTTAWTAHLLEEPRFEYIAGPPVQFTESVRFRQIDTSPDGSLFRIAETMHETKASYIDPSAWYLSQAGTRINGYAPIFDSQGEMVGVLRIAMTLPFDTFDLYRQVRDVGNTLFVLDGILVVGGIAFFIRRYVRGRKLPLE